MQPRFPPPTGLPPAPGAPRPMFQPPPQFMPPGAIPPPQGMMHGMPMGMHPGMGFPGQGMAMHPGQVNYGMPPPQYQYQAPPAAFAAPPRPAQSVIVGAPVLRTAAAPAPPAPLPLTPAPAVVISAASAIHDFNFSNPAAVFMNATSSLLNKVIFNNPAAALPLTVYIGQVPLDMSDQTLMKVLEVCGKIFKYSRPVDPSTTLPTPFALVTYSQALCAARCVTALNNYVVDAVECVAFVVKAGTKETAQLESILKTEQEAAAQLPEGYSLEEGIYGPIRAAIDATLAAANGATTTATAGVSGSGGDNVGENGLASSVSNGDLTSGTGMVEGSSVDNTGTTSHTTVNPTEVEAGEITEPSNTNIPTPSTTNNTTTNNDSTIPMNYYNHLDTIDSMVNNINATGNSLSTITAFHNTNTTAPIIGEDGEIVVDEAGEKMLMSEIEKFRLRQMQRDKEVEEERKRKIKQKMQELKQMQQFKAEREARALAEGLLNPLTSSALNNNTISGNSSGNNNNTASVVTEPAPPSNKRSVELSAEELEAKRQRKLQVLQMLSGGGDDDEPIDNNNNNIKLSPSMSTSASANDLTSTTITTTAMDTTATIATTAATATITANNPVKKISIKNKLTSVPSKSTFGPTEDDEHKPIREIVKLEYTPEELSAMQSASASYMGDNDYHTDYDFGIGKKHVVGVGAAVPTAPALDISTLQALAVAKAHAVSLALKSSTAAASASVSAPAPAGAESKTEQDKLKSLVDKIPAARDELLAYPIGWSTLSQHNILNEVMNTWVSKKITEHLGEEEPSLVEFIMGKLASRCSAADLLEELSVVLDEAAEPFVLKLWRMLVYYTVKNQ